jgi:hypothetical protein
MLLSAGFVLNRRPVSTAGLPDWMRQGGDSAVKPGSDVPRPVFSETGFFHSGAVEIRMSVPGAEPGDGTKIHYTTDGSIPTSTCDEFIAPLRFEAGEELRVVTLKAVTVRDGEASRPAVQSYFLGKDVFNRFDTLVFSLSTDPAHLYDYDTGILVEGRLRDDFTSANPNAELIPTDPANYNRRGRESERPVYVEVFEPDGERVAAQAAGMRVHGGWTRQQEQKALRLIARSAYEPGAGKFHYDFFPGETKAGNYGAPLAKFDQLILRAGGSDRYNGMFRNELGSALARLAGLRTVTPSRAAAVFINGEYYGFAWVNVRINGKYLQDVYGAPDDDFQIIGKYEMRVEGDDPNDIAALRQLTDFLQRDLTDDAVFAEFEKLVDIDDLLLYYAFQIAIDSRDWMKNNVKRWRYTGKQVPGLAPELDGRWRFLVYDLDLAMGLAGDPSEAEFATVTEVMTEGEPRYSYFLAALLQREDLREQFITILCEMASRVVTGEVVTQTAGRLTDESENEIKTALEAGRYPVWMTAERLERGQTAALLFAERRAGFLLSDTRSAFGLGEGMFTVERDGAETRYFDCLSVSLKPDVPKFEVFDRWLVNGEPVVTPELAVSAADAIGGIVRIEQVTREETPPLVFAEAYASSGGNGCALINPSGEAVETTGLYLTDNPNNPFLFALPGARVRPGGTLELAGKDSNGPGDLHKIRMGFNAKSGRMIYLCGADGRVLDTIIVK